MNPWLKSQREGERRPFFSVLADGGSVGNEEPIKTTFKSVAHFQYNSSTGGGKDDVRIYCIVSKAQQYIYHNKMFVYL